MATWAERFDQYRTQELDRRRQEQERNALADILRSSYVEGTPATPDRPYTEQDVGSGVGPLAMGQPIPGTATPATPGRFDMQNAIARMAQSRFAPEALKLMEMMKPRQTEYTLGEIGAGNDQVQSVVFDKASGQYRPIGETRRKTATPDWMMPGYIDAQRKIAQAKLDGKPAKLPPTALKMQQEELDAIAISSNISADLDAIKKQVDEGSLSIGPISNLLAQGKNWVGASDESSRKFATFRATLERMRNDSLRLNKGVQTEGDAQRAWNELMANINDPKLVSDRLSEIKGINERAATIRNMNVENIRQNFGLEPLDTSGYTSQPSPLGAGQTSPPNGAAKLKQKATGRQIPSTGPRPGTIDNGYIFMGGNPADPSRWKKQ